MKNKNQNIFLYLLQALQKLATCHSEAILALYFTFHSHFNKFLVRGFG